MIEGGSKDGWFGEDLEKFKEAWENSKIEEFEAKCKSLGKMVGKSTRQCMIKAALMDLDPTPSQ